MFKTLLLIVAKDGKQDKCTMEYYLEMKQNTDTTWVKILTKKSQRQKNTYLMIPFI